MLFRNVQSCRSPFVSAAVSLCLHTICNTMFAYHSQRQVVCPSFATASPVCFFTCADCSQKQDPTTAPPLMEPSTTSARQTVALPALDNRAKPSRCVSRSDWASTACNKDALERAAGHYDSRRIARRRAMLGTCPQLARPAGAAVSAASPEGEVVAERVRRREHDGPRGVGRQLPV
jgi:hypothetical protein